MSAENDNEDVVEYELKPVPDGIRVTLSQAHRLFLEFIASRGGETPFDWSKVSDRVATHTRKLLSMTLISETPLIGTPRVLLRLTDMGRNIVTQIIASKARA